ncbi:Hypothetical predicted protein [Drosophila guanche]|uniref:Uncharacterized protein n=2 Tax=Drosophila guanche TaxID=7266 RepID=A0A3B0KXU0_DROGU|nr:Hypothetical predicted protein [Drosophila guanche]
MRCAARSSLMPPYRAVPSASSGPVSRAQTASRPRALFALVDLVRIISATWPPSILLLAWLYRCRLSCNGLRSDHLASGMSSVCNSTVLLEGRTIGFSWNATPPVASCSFSRFPDDISDI